MIFADYAFFCFFWNCLLSIDSALRINTAKVQSKPQFLTLLIIIVNVALLQFALPVIGYIHFFKDVPPEQRVLAVWFAVIIAVGSVSVVFPYRYLVKYRLRTADWFLCAVLCVSMLVCAFSLKSFDKNHDGLMSTGSLLVAAAFFLGYGVFCLKRITKRLTLTRYHRDGLDTKK